MPPLAILATLAFISFSSVSLAQDRPPSTGLLFNAKEVHSLRYSCSPPSNGTISCNFTQVAVRPKLTKSEAEKSIQQVREQFKKTGSVFSIEDCKVFEQVLDVLEGRIVPPKADEFEKMSSLQKRDMGAMARAVSQACKSKTEADTIAAHRVFHDKDFRTCKVSSFSFSQSFRRASNTAGGPATWVVQAQPEGPCGTVQLSRFEYEKAGSLNFGVWNYISRKAITNPNAVLFPGTPPMLCSSLDQAEYQYIWTGQEHALGCDYIEFSAL